MSQFSSTKTIKRNNEIHNHTRRSRGKIQTWKARTNKEVKENKVINYCNALPGEILKCNSYWTFRIKLRKFRDD